MKKLYAALAASAVLAGCASTASQMDFIRHSRGQEKTDLSEWGQSGFVFFSVKKNGLEINRVSPTIKYSDMEALKTANAQADGKEKAWHDCIYIQRAEPRYQPCDQAAGVGRADYLNYSVFRKDKTDANGVINGVFALPFAIVGTAMDGIFGLNPKKAVESSAKSFKKVTTQAVFDNEAFNRFAVYADNELAQAQKSLNAALTSGGAAASDHRYVGIDGLLTEAKLKRVLAGADEARKKSVYRVVSRVYPTDHYEKFFAADVVNAADLPRWARLMESMGQKGKIRPEVAKKIPGFREDIPANEFLDSNEYRYVLAHAGQPKARKIQEYGRVMMALDYPNKYTVYVQQNPQCQNTGSSSENRSLGFFETFLMSSNFKGKTVNFNHYTCRLSQEQIDKLSAIEQRITGNNEQMRTLQTQWSYRWEGDTYYNKRTAEEKETYQREVNHIMNSKNWKCSIRCGASWGGHGPKTEILIHNTNHENAREQAEKNGRLFCKNTKGESSFTSNMVDTPHPNVSCSETY